MPLSLPPRRTLTPTPAPLGERTLTRRSLLLSSVALAVTAGGAEALAQAGGGLVFTRVRPPRDMVGNIRGWANSNRATAYDEDTQNHLWRVYFMAFLARPANVQEITLSWFQVQGSTRRYVTNESIALSNPSDRIFFHTTTVRRAVGEFEPNNRYEALLAVNDARGQTALARGTIQLNGIVERPSGVVDFTRPAT